MDTKEQFITLLLDELEELIATRGRGDTRDQASRRVSALIYLLDQDAFLLERESRTEFQTRLVSISLQFKLLRAPRMEQATLSILNKL